MRLVVLILKLACQLQQQQMYWQHNAAKKLLSLQKIVVLAGNPFKYILEKGGGESDHYSHMAENIL